MDGQFSQLRLYLLILHRYSHCMLYWIFCLKGPISRTGSSNNGNEARGFSEEDWERLNKIIGYKEGSDEFLLDAQDDGNLAHLFLEIHMKHNASKLISEGHDFLANLSCEGLVCSIKTYSEAKVFNLKLESYRLSSRYGHLAEV